MYALRTDSEARVPVRQSLMGLADGRRVVVTAEEKRRALRERAVAWVEKSCAEQGVPVKLSDQLALADIAAIPCSGHEKRAAGNSTARVFHRLMRGAVA